MNLTALYIFCLQSKLLPYQSQSHITASPNDLCFSCFVSVSELPGTYWTFTFSPLLNTKF